MMRRVPAVLVFATAIAGAALLSGCAARGATPRPFPAPGPGLAAGQPVGTADIPALLATALGQVGTPYRFGGQSPAEGFDCSGFVMWVFAQHGVPLPRTVVDLFSTGQALGSRAPLHPGDLVFFETKGPGATHVGISLGDRRFVHAPSTNGAVRVEDLYSEYWAGRYLGARRLVVPRSVEARGANPGTDP